jgi:ParB/RepB/Spo0J family partition protein
MKVVDIPIDQIDIGERRRSDYGDIGALAKGIKRVGLLGAIVVNSDGNGRYRLVAGERRLRAVRMLKWKAIPAQLLESLSEAELRDLELEENENRKNLTERERGRTFAAAKKVKESAEKAAEILENSSPVIEGPRGRGQPPKAASTRAVAEALGVDRMDVRRARQQVETAEQFPFMQTGKWRQSDVLRIRERIEELPEAERESAATVLGCAKVMDPDLAVTLVENIVAHEPKQRQEIFELARSSDPRDQSLALTKAAKLPPMPDKRLGIIDNAAHILNAAIKPYPKDAETPMLEKIRSELAVVRARIKTRSYDAQRDQGGKVQ